MDVDKRNGDLYITNVGRNQILKYAKDDWNNPIVIAGSGEKGYEDGTCATASFCSPWGIAVAPDGNIYVAGNGATDANAQANNLDQSIRYIDMSTHMVTTFAGCNESGNMDGTFATLTWGGVNYPSEKLTAAFGSATAVCVGNDGTVYVLDRKNNSVKKITTIE